MSPSAITRVGGIGIAETVGGAASDVTVDLEIYKGEEEIGRLIGG